MQPFFVRKFKRKFFLILIDAQHHIPKKMVACYCDHFYLLTKDIYHLSTSTME